MSDETSQGETQQAASAGWFDDPEVEGGKRYWDGEQWTDRRKAPRETREAKKERRKQEAQRQLETIRENKKAAKRERDASKQSTTNLPTADAGVAARVAKLRQRVKTALAANLKEDEVIQVVISGANGQAIVGTKKRLFVLKPGWLAGATLGSEVTSWSYRNLLGIQVHKGMMTGAVIIQAPGQSGQSTSYWGQKGDDPYKSPNAIPVGGDWDTVKRGVAALQALIDEAHSPDPQPNTATTTSLAGELQKLAELRDAGVLTEEEFTSAKKRLVQG